MSHKLKVDFVTFSKVKRCKFCGENIVFGLQMYTKKWWALSSDKTKRHDCPEHNVPYEQIQHIRDIVQGF